MLQRHAMTDTFAELSRTLLTCQCQRSQCHRIEWRHRLEEGTCLQTEWETQQEHKKRWPIPSAVFLLRFWMVRIFESQIRNLSPPARVIFVARHDDIIHENTLCWQQLILYFSNTTRYDRRGSKTVFEVKVSAINFEIVMAGVNNNILCVG